LYDQPPSAEISELPSHHRKPLRASMVFAMDVESADKKNVNSIIAKYLSRNYLRHPLLDWIFLDMTISRAVCAYGEFRKMASDLSVGHEGYLSAEGNLAEMKKSARNEFFERCVILLSSFFFAWAVPAGAMWVLFHWDIGVWLAGIYAFIIFSIMLFDFSGHLIRRLTGKVDPRTRVVNLWVEMYDVWQLLEGPVVNPTLVREAMIKSRDKGAAWDNVSWSLIDRVIAIDPAVWVVEPERS